ncbi:uncharacterized protein RHIMIDRAFT_294649 [Rhizopus microsporus ATCC 52813]|uniref:Uncharacterized protein n=1 Tax=Rhizopus microsporus ATCC 52813 TaxID=1340429 RepID=A0A2G4SK43_RHIZD|nr:uncharacterized protein RHIMIDRAFT_294649 [Rhizopus microsporus ATCC 52813]PHZ09139.1 hypothetical protein RHIMIDRAFT_294649 [Rhizopus microsporus ATCC 52813]
MNKGHTPKTKLSNYLDESKLPSKQRLKKPEKNDNYHWGSLPLWTTLRSNNTKIISNATNEKLLNTATTSGLWPNRSTNPSYQNLNNTLLTQLKSLTLTTKERRTAGYTEEQQPKFMNSSPSSKQEKSQQKKLINFWTKPLKAPKDLQFTPGSKVYSMMKMLKTTPLERLNYPQILNTWKQKNQATNEKHLVKILSPWSGCVVRRDTHSWMTDDPLACPYLGLLKASYLHGHTPPTWTALSSLDIFLIIRGIAQWMCKLGRVVEGLPCTTKPTTSNEYLEQPPPTCQTEEVEEDIQLPHIGTTIEEDVDTLDVVEQKTALEGGDVGTQPSTTTTTSPTIFTVQHQQTFQHQEIPVTSNTKLIPGNTGSYIVSSTTINTTISTTTPTTNNDTNIELYYSIRRNSSGRPTSTIFELLEDNNKSSLAYIGDPAWLQNPIYKNANLMEEPETTNNNGRSISHQRSNSEISEWRNRPREDRFWIVKS